MPLSLHIFEERYKEMVAHCLQDNSSFGVVLIKEGVEALGPLAQPYTIGCTAQITQVQPLDEGRMNLIVIGHERFKVHTLDYTLPYLAGDIVIAPIAVRQRSRSPPSRTRPLSPPPSYGGGREGESRTDAL